MNRLYYGDNLTVLREHITDESVDLVYLDPPFNARRVPKIQIMTIEGLLSGQESPKYPDLSRGSLSFKKAKAESEVGEQGKLF